MIPTAISALYPRLIPKEEEGATSGTKLKQLTAALACGDDHAWLKFHRSYGPAVFRQLLALTKGDEDLAKEALQQTYLRIAKHVRTCEVEAIFKGWRRTVARTALQDCWRRRRSFMGLLVRKHQEPLELPNSSSDERLMEALDQALACLAPAERLLLEAKYFTGLDVRTLAVDLSISPKAVESRLTRAREALKREILAGLNNHD
jgi:RNA polymerase sigma factor (sigma-70 family)